MRQDALDKRRDTIRGMFGRIAPRYDLLNRVLSLGQDVLWRRAVVRRVEALGLELVVDACTGTGDLALALEGRSSRPIGSDFCLPMVVLARAKAARRKAEVPWIIADCLRMPVRDDLADGVTVAFGVRNFADLDCGLAELARLLRPGGRLLVLEFARPSGWLAPLLSWWVRTVPPRVGRWISGDEEAYHYLPASVESFVGADEMCDRLRRAGLDGVTVRRLTGGVAALYEGARRHEAGATSRSDREKRT